MTPSDTAPIRAYCRECRHERRFLFSGFATATGAENTVRPRAEQRRCATCSLVVLRLGDVTDAENLVRALVFDWERSLPAGHSVDIGELGGYLNEQLWVLYLRWDPSGLRFTSYATGLLRKKLAQWVEDTAGGIRSARNGHGNLVTRYPKAHSAAVSESYERIIDGTDQTETRDSRATEDRTGTNRLEFALGAFAPDLAGDRSTDLGRVLYK